MTRSSGIRRCLTLVVVGVTLGVVTVPRARAGLFEGLAGWEGDDHRQGYGFLGAGALVPAGHLILPARITASYLYYQYDSTSTTISVRSPGVSLMAGARVTGERGSATAMAGAEVRREHRVADLPGSPSRDLTTTGVVVQADGDLVLARRWHALALANFAGAASYFFGRGAVRYQATNPEWRGPTTLFVGAEGVGQGNDESAATQGGGFVECNFVPQRLSVGLRGGYKESWSPGQAHRTGGYLGVTVYRRF
jgi:hypothetical protein